MMIGALAMAILLAAALAAYHFTTRFSVRTANDVYPFLLNVDMEALNGTFYPEAEEEFRNRHSPEEFKNCLLYTSPSPRDS